MNVKQVVLRCRRVNGSPGIISFFRDAGTIFGVYLADPQKSAIENVLQRGSRQVAGGYCLYSSSTVRLPLALFPVYVQEYAKRLVSGFERADSIAEYEVLHQGHAECR